MNLIDSWPWMLWVVLIACALLAGAAFRWPEKAKHGWESLGDVARGSPMLLLFVITFLVVIYLNPAKVGVAWWGVCKLMLSGYAGYWIDRLVFRPEDRPHMVEGIARGTAWKRRALIVAAAIIAGGLIP